MRARLLDEEECQDKTRGEPEPGRSLCHAHLTGDDWWGERQCKEKPGVVRPICEQPVGLPKKAASATTSAAPPDQKATVGKTRRYMTSSAATIAATTKTK